jgi:hypothetical protein
MRPRAVVRRHLMPVAPFLCSRTHRRMPLKIMVLDDGRGVDAFQQSPILLLGEDRRLAGAHSTCRSPSTACAGLTART